jgi:hypothetical protein
MGFIVTEKRIVVFDTEEEAAELEWLAWIAMVEQAVQGGETAKTPAGDFITDLTGLSDDDKYSLKICGHLQGQLVYDNGTTATFSDVTPRYIDPDDPAPPPIKYWIPIPLGLVDLTGYTVMDELPAEWRPPAEV